MRIGIDARLIQETGVGRYIRNLLVELGKIDDQNEYIVYLSPAAFPNFVLPNRRWKKRLVTIHWHTIAEQVILPVLYLQDRLDLLHVPYFTVPILYPGRIICTIHDLTILHVRTGKATKLPLPLYYAKHLGYRIIVALGIWRSQKIITVSKTIAQEITETYHVSGKKIITTYEGIDEQLLTKEKKLTADVPFFLYVGNAYPHKNLDVLLQSIKQMKSDSQNLLDGEHVKFMFIGKIDYFYTQLKNKAQKLDIFQYIKLAGLVDDEYLAALYHTAIATVFPSTMEGFGLPALEALALDSQPIVSEIPVFQEILAGSPAKFVPNIVTEWTRALEWGIDQWKHQKPIWKTKAEKQLFLQRFSWKKMGQDTLSLYEDCNRL